MILSIMFFAGAKLRDKPVMPAEVYGAWVTEFPAEWWAQAVMAASTIYLVGIFINGHWRWSPVLRVLGCVLHVIVMSAFVRGASDAIYGDFFVMICAVIGGAHMWFLAWNLGDLARAMGRR